MLKNEIVYSPDYLVNSGGVIAIASEINKTENISLEINADVLLMAKNNVDGVYDSDPNENSDAVRFGNLDYMDALSRRLDVMDSTALSLCMDNKLPIVVFNVFEPGTLGDILNGADVGTLINGRD